MKTWLITARIWSSRSICALDNRLGLKIHLSLVDKIQSTGMKCVGLIWTYILGSFKTWRRLFLEDRLLIVDFRLGRFRCSFSLFSFSTTRGRCWALVLSQLEIRLTQPIEMLENLPKVKCDVAFIGSFIMRYIFLKIYFGAGLKITHCMTVRVINMSHTWLLSNADATTSSKWICWLILIRNCLYKENTARQKTYKPSIACIENIYQHLKFCTA